MSEEQMARPKLETDSKVLYDIRELLHEILKIMQDAGSGAVIPQSSIGSAPVWSAGQPLQCAVSCRMTSAIQSPATT